MKFKLGPAGTHSWETMKTVEREDGTLVDVKWACRLCGTKKELNFKNRVEYKFPKGHAERLPEGLPMSGRAGACPSADTARNNQPPRPE